MAAQMSLSNMQATVSYSDFSNNVVLEIVGQASCFDLVVLSGLDKRTRRVIETNQAQLFNVANARLGVPPFPVYDCPSDVFKSWNDFSYAAFLFGDEYCSLCGEMDLFGIGTARETLPMLLWGMNFHNWGCLQSPDRFQAPKLVSLERYLSIVGNRDSRLQAHRTWYPTILPTTTVPNGEEVLYNWAQLEAADRAYLALTLTPVKMQFWYFDMTRNLNTCLVAADKCSTWREAYEKGRNRIHNANVVRLELFVVQENYDFSILKKTKTAIRLVHAFSRDCSRLTKAAWVGNRPQIHIEYWELKNSGALLPLPVEPGCQRCVALTGHAQYQHIRDAHRADHPVSNQDMPLDVKGQTKVTKQGKKTQKRGALPTLPAQPGCKRCGELADNALQQHIRAQHPSAIPKSERRRANTRTRGGSEGTS